MPRRATGTISSRTWKDGRTVTWRLRVRAFGRRIPIVLGTNHEGWSEERSKVELERIIGQIERGTWHPPEPGPAPAEAVDDETMRVTISRWWQRKKRDLEPNTEADYLWRLSYVRSFFETIATGDVDVRLIDQFTEVLRKQRTQHDKPLSPRSINMVLGLLAQVLDLAVEYKLLDHNPARGKNRRVREGKSSRSFLEPDMVVDLLRVAGEWERDLEDERKRPDQCYGRRAFLALQCLAGPRISEAINADRGDFDLAGDRWRIPDAKTAAGHRDIELTSYLAEELRSHVARMDSLGRPIKARSPMFATVNGGRLNASNVRSRLLAPVVEKVNEARAEADQMLLPAVTPHALRRTFASMCFFASRDPIFVMGQLGHTDPKLTLAVYAQTMQRKRLDRDLVWRLMRFSDEDETPPSASRNGPTIGSTGQKQPSDDPGRVRGA